MFGYEFFYAMGTIGVCACIVFVAWIADKMAVRMFEKWRGERDADS